MKVAPLDEDTWKEFANKNLRTDGQGSGPYFQRNVLYRTDYLKLIEHVDAGLPEAIHIAELWTAYAVRQKLEG